MIPKIIWQTYESEYNDLPPKALEFSDSWKKQNPDWEYKYVNAKEREEFILNNFDKEWHTIYTSYKINSMKAGLWKFMCVYLNGGLSTDLDMLCKKPIEEFFDLSKDFIASEEPLGPGYSDMIFAANKKNVILENVLNNVKKEYYEKNEYGNRVDYVANNAGYVVFTKSILETSSSENFDKNTFKIYTNDEAKKIHTDAITHYIASNNPSLFGPNYISWKRQSYI